MPKHLDVLGQRYRLKRVKRLIERQEIEGYVDAHKYEIGVDASLTGLIYRRVLYHEIGHAFAYESGLHEVLPIAAIEMFCQAFSSLLEQLSGPELIHAINDLTHGRKKPLITALARKRSKPIG